MSRAWIQSKSRISQEYKDGIKSFLDVARKHLNEDKKCRCPCKECQNGSSCLPLADIRNHIMRFGFTPSYDVWVYHGEKEMNHLNEVPEDNNVIDEEEEDEEYDNAMGYILEDFTRGLDNANGEPPTASVTDLFGEYEEKLYTGCHYSSLEAIVRLMQIKVLNHWSNKSFDAVLAYMHLMWPNLKNFPKSYYEAKKRLRNVGLGYEKIDACKYDCALFWKEHAEAENCPVCKESRYKTKKVKGKKIPHKCLRYFPLTRRLQRLYLSRHTAKDMRWHKEKRDDTSDLLSHPADGESWKTFDQTYPEFASDARNVRLGLAADGFTPFSGGTGGSYSMWPVIIVPYNFPPWKCMKEPFRMMSLLIPGPQSPGKEIDVYLRPLIDELKDLWSMGAKTYDAHSHTNFQMRACLLWTINDFPAYGSLSGWSTHGFKACPVCMDDTTSKGITDKISFMGARRWLSLDHRWRKSKLHDGEFELRLAPRIKSGDEILSELECINVTLGKHPTNKDHKRKRSLSEANWTKKSIFFDLPYWSKLSIRHILDVMHIEKNICDNILYTLLNTDGKTKDTIKARLDLERLKIRRNLHIQKLPNGKMVKPTASYVLTSSDRSKFLEFITHVKFPDGYAANISRGVNVRQGKIFGLKSHDCHVMLQRLLPIGIRAFLPKDVCTTLVELSNFFQQLTSKTLRKSDLDKLDESIVTILCKMERIYPPAFFDVMIHLSIHLVREVRLAGPVGPRWMYPFERDMGACKKYVRNRAHPEGSIAEGCIVNEALTFCSMYFDNIETKFSRPERNIDEVNLRATISVFSQTVKPFGQVTHDNWSRELREKAQWTVLRNCEEISNFLNEHMEELEMENSDNLFERQQQAFPSWFEKRIKTLRNEGSALVNDELYSLACGPELKVFYYPNCIVNGVRFRKRAHDEDRKTQNSGVAVLAEFDDDEINYYGYLSNVVVLQYFFDFQVVLFHCEWYDTNPKKNRVKKDHHFISVDSSKKWCVDDPFIIASQAKQVFYVDDLKLGRNWKVIQNVQQRHVWDALEKEDVDDDLNVLTNPYQQDEADVNVFEVDQNDIIDDLQRGDVDVIDVTEQHVAGLHQIAIGSDDYECSLLSDEEDSDECLDASSSDDSD